jgi:hypothetical protein|tara:strand:- start:889 stop:1338 length:450 start_codon:yes stop_codon:yes gene_type:complete
MKKFLFAFIFFISSCGYQPIYINNNLKNFEFNKIITEGESDINRKIIKSVLFKENRTNALLNQLLLKSSFKVEETSKNKKGQVNSYRSSIIINLSINKDNEVIKNKSFLGEFTYNNKENKFELVEYQAGIKEDLINQVIEEIILYLNLQ